MNGLSAECVRKGGAGRDAPANLLEPIARGLLLEGDDLAVAVELEESHRRRIVDRHRLRRDSDVGLPIDVRLDHLVVVHAVQMIAGKNQVVVGVVAHEVPRRLPHRVGRPLKPVRVVGRLLGREDFHEPRTEQIHPVRLRDVPVERRRVELREDEDAPDVGVQAIADRNVDQAVLAADRDSRLRAMLRQRKQTRTLTAPEDEREHLVVRCHVDESYTADNRAPSAVSLRQMLPRRRLHFAAASHRSSSLTQRSCFLKQFAAGRIMTLTNRSKNVTLTGRKVERRQFLRGAMAAAGTTAALPALEALGLLGINGRVQAAPGKGGYGPTRANGGPA